MLTSLLGRREDSGASEWGLICLLELVVRMRRSMIVCDWMRSARILEKAEMGRSALRGIERVGGSERPGRVVRRTLTVAMLTMCFVCLA